LTTRALIYLARFMIRRQSARNTRQLTQPFSYISSVPRRWRYGRGTPTCPLHCTCALLGSAGSPCPSFKPSTVHINIYILYVHGSCDQLAASHCFYILYDALTPALLLVVLAVQIKPLLVNARLVAGYTRSYGLFPQL
jgi:hypothetical protein